MLAGIALQEASSSGGSVWFPVLVLGWFVVMTLVGWQASRRTGAAGAGTQDTDTSHSESNPSELDHH